MLNTSLTLTPNAIHFVRSMSRYNHGVLAAELLKRRTRLGDCLACSVI